MRIRQWYLERERGVGDAETLIWNLNQTDPITAIELRFDATTDTPDAGTMALLRDIQDLQLVDGGSIIQSGGAHILQAMSYGMKVPGSHLGQILGLDGTRAEATVMLLFGRCYGDRENFLRPSDFNNLQLRFTSALTVAVGDYDTGSLRCTIIVHTLAETGLTKRGTVYIKEVAAQTVAANTEERIDMPVDRPWVNLAIFNESAAGLALHPVPTVSNVKLSQNGDEYIPFDLRSRDIIIQNIRALGVHYNVEAALDAWAVNQMLGIVMPNITLEAHYVIPYGGIFIPFWNECSDTFWTPPSNGSVRLILTGGGTGGVARVVLAQLVS